MTWLRIIQINDVYEIIRFPHLRTLINERSKASGTSTTKADDEGSTASAVESTTADEIDLCLVVCVGDFLAPSLLSSLDKGVAMVDMLNRIGCNYVCLGNHETDVPMDALAKRIQQSNFVWINSNMPELNQKLDVETPTDVVISVGNGNTSKVRTVALLGLLTEDESLYRPDAFGGATIRPVLQTAREFVEKFTKDENKVDLILPLTHQGIKQDRCFAEEFGGTVFPLILGGHDHEPYDEIVAGCQIVKTGMDAQFTGIIDVQWDDNSADPNALPTMKVEMLTTTDYAPDPDMAQRVEGHQDILKELDSARLFQIKDWLGPASYPSTADDAASAVVFSTRDNRLGPSIGTSAIASMLGMGMRCQCALINAGAIRGGRDYDAEHHFTWSDLKAEVPFATLMVVHLLPGRVVQETIQHSRRYASQKIAAGGYIHTSWSIVYNDATNQIESIADQPFDPDKNYLTTFPHDFLQGIDNHEPLLNWMAANAPDFMKIEEEAAVPAKLVLVQVFSTIIWLRLGTFSQVSHGHKAITKADVKQRMMSICGGHEGVADLMVDNVFAMADLDHDGTISAMEQMVVGFVAKDMLSHVETDKEGEVMESVASNVLGEKTPPRKIKWMAEKIRDAIDVSGDGSIQREEITKVLGDVCSVDLLT